MLRSIRTLVVATGTLGTLLVVLVLHSPSNESESPDLLSVIPKKATWFKGNLHTHSLWSDGDDFPEMIADWYKRQGYHFLALSDHNILSEGERWIPIQQKGTFPTALNKYQARFGRSWVELRDGAKGREVRLKPLAEFRSLLEEPGNYLLIQAEEITHAYAKRPVHLNAINLRDLIKPIDGGSASETISVNHRAVTEQARRTKIPMLVFLNHPNFQWGITAEDMIQAPELRFFEVYNGHPGVRNEGDKNHPSCEELWDIVLALRLGKHGLGVVQALATDDAHRYHKFGVGEINPGRGWIMVNAPYLTAEAIVKAIDRGDFYASTGVLLDEVQIGPESISLKIRGEPGVTYRTDFIATLKEASLDSTPRILSDDKKLAALSRIYSADLGKIVATSESLSSSYKLVGNELYVRARVTSSKEHPNPYRKGDKEMAWTQPAVASKP